MIQISKPNNNNFLQRFLNRKTYILNRGFTLIEILIIVAIIALFILLGIGVYLRQMAKSRDARRKSDIHRIQVAVEEYEKDHDCYPPLNKVVCVPGDGLQPYLSKIPCDPKTGASYLYDYDTTNPSCSKWYRLFSRLENSGDPDYLASIGPDATYSYFQSSPNAPEPFLFDSGVYGCKSGVCVPLYYDSRRPGLECDPHFGTSYCNNACGTEAAKCEPWE